MNPVNKVVITRVSHDATRSDTVVFQIPDTVAEHNVLMEVLKKIRQDHPGVWFCAQEWERNEKKDKIGRDQTSQMPVVLKADSVGKVKAVSKEYFNSAL